MKKNKTEIELVEDFLKKEGFTEIKEKEKNSPEFRDSLIKIRNLKQKIKKPKKFA